MTQVALVEACDSQVALQLMHGEGTRNALVSFRLSAAFRAEVRCAQDRNSYTLMYPSIAHAPFWGKRPDSS